MHDGSGRIVVQNLTKNFGQVAAVQNLSFHVEPGSVTGFLGPNGAGKTTTLRMLLGLVNPSAGWATINGQPFHRLQNPARVVGAVLEAQGFHPSRTARDHLRVYCAAMGVPNQRADEVLNLVGLGTAATRGAGGFSLGMKQRLALATALLGDPQVLVLDEPANGLDPEGIAWLRTFLKAFAASGRTVLISSHLLAEVEQTIDQVVIISHGQTRYNGPLDELRKSQQSRVIVQPADANKLVTALQEAELSNVTPLPDGKVAIVGASVQQIGDVAAKAGVALYGVQEEKVDLEQLFFRLTSGQYAAPGIQGGYAQPVQQQQGHPHQPGYGTPPQGYHQQQGTPPGGWGQQPPVAPPPQQPGMPPEGWASQGQQPGMPAQPQGQPPQPPQQGTPPGGWGQPGVQPGQPPEAWTQQPGTPPQGWNQQPEAPPETWNQQPDAPPQGWTQQPGTPPETWNQQPDAPPQGWNQQPGTPPQGWNQQPEAPPETWNQQPNTPPGGWGPPPPQQPEQDQQPGQGAGGVGGNA